MRGIEELLRGKRMRKILVELGIDGFIPLAFLC